MKAKINISIDESAWHTFRVECVKRQVSASSEVEALIQKRLAEWEKKEKGGESKKK